jgi:RNA polymerase sigma factor (sigma-70 family)
MVRYACHWIHDADSADDVVQTIFVRLLGAQDVLSTVDRGFLRKAVRNAIIDARRRNARSARVAPWLTEIHDPVAPTVMLDEDGRPRQLAEWIATLSPRQRQVIELSIQGRSLKSIAELLEIEFETVHTHHTRALAKLKSLAERERYPKDGFLLVLGHHNWRCERLDYRSMPSIPSS